MSPFGHDPYQPYSNAARYSPDARGASRTPSPSPSEIAVLNQKSMFDIRGIFNKEKLLSKQYFGASFGTSLGPLFMPYSVLFGCNPRHRHWHSGMALRQANRTRNTTCSHMDAQVSTGVITTRAIRLISPFIAYRLAG